MVRPTYTPPPDWQTQEGLPGDVAPADTGWQVKDPPPGFTKLVEGYRTLRGKPRVAHLVYSDGLVAVSVFVEPMPQAPQPIGATPQQDGVNQFRRQLSDHLVTVLGETPGATVRQIAFSVTARPIPAPVPAQPPK
jgi:sigma-E factor negative regulatory protein RseB